ncbi:hypothetical protein F4803DRAFT_107113 [Xylaria telfairii]|nr:hypothetical protein F4803DRAFT_107113 [Xylaria telfairii]
MSGQDAHELVSGPAHGIPESSPPPCFTTDERHFRGVDVPNTADAGLATSFEDGGPWHPWPRPGLNPAIYFRDTDNISLDNIHPREANQTLEQWYHCPNIPEATGHVPQVAADSVFDINQDMGRSFLESSHPSIMNQAPMTTTNFLQLQYIDQASQENPLSPTSLSPRFTDTAIYTGNVRNSGTSMFQSPRVSNNALDISQECSWLLPPASGLVSIPLSSVNGPCEPMPGFIPRGSLVNGSVRNHLSTRLEDSSNMNPYSRGARKGAKPKSRTRGAGVEKIKVFACHLDSCGGFEAKSKKDLLRHLQSDKHRKGHVDTSPPGDRSYCEIPECGFADVGFSRRDNMMRHMSTMHDIEIDREKAGRKRSRDEQDGEPPSEPNTPL